MAEGKRQQQHTWNLLAEPNSKAPREAWSRRSSSQPGFYNVCQVCLSCNFRKGRPPRIAVGSEAGQRASRFSGIATSSLGSANGTFPPTPLPTPDFFLPLFPHSWSSVYKCENQTEFAISQPNSLDVPVAHHANSRYHHRQRPLQARSSIVPLIYL